MKFYFTLLYCLLSICCFSQSADKPVIDERAIDNWTKMGPWPFVSVNDNASFFCYPISRQPSSGSSLVIQSLKDRTRYEFRGASNLVFYPDNYRSAFLIRDTLYMMNLKTGEIRKERGVSGVAKLKNSSSTLIYQYSENKKVIVENSISGHKTELKEVIDFSADNIGNSIIFNTDQGRILLLFDIRSGKTREIWNGNEKYRALSYCFDATGSKIAFLAKNSIDQKFSVWLYEVGMDRAIQKVGEGSTAANLFISPRPVMFSGNGRAIFFQVETERPVMPKDAVKVDVWNFRDQFLQSLQLTKSIGPTFTYAVQTGNESIVPLESENEKLISLPSSITGDYAITSRNRGDRFWEECDSCENSAYLVSLENGEKKKLPIMKYKQDYFFAPDGQHLLIYSGGPHDSDYFNYDLKSGKLINISSSVPRMSLNFDDGYNEQLDLSPVDLAGWIAKEDAVLVYDNFDIWKFYLSGDKVAENITAGYGKKKNIRFRLAFEGQRLKSDDVLLLSAFDWNTKKNGFYSVDLKRPGNPDSLCMDNWIVNLRGRGMLPVNDGIPDIGMPPIRAKNAKSWIVRGQSTNDAPNYYQTSDFRKFRRLTNLQPQNPYNWFTSELVSFKDDNGRTISAVLYKPENFDKSKKYPVIIYHYRPLSQRLNCFLDPAFSGGPVNIPWFVSRGYLILTPDTYINSSGPGPSALTAMEASLRWLKSQSYVNANGIGLNGHSRSGFQANYVAAHSNEFAAILAGAGGADAITSAFSLNGEQGSRLEAMENANGVSLWENKGFYLQNSPLLDANMVHTPLLLFHCKGDGSVPFDLSLQYFSALRRLRKPVWMLQYDGGSHVLKTIKDAKDYTVRITQFFDHYLKGAAAPVWMTKGVPARLKGVDTGLELDIEGSKNLPSNPYLKN